MKYLCIILWQVEVFADDNDETNDTNKDANDDDALWTKHDCTRLFG